MHWDLYIFHKDNLFLGNTLEEKQKQKSHTQREKKLLNEIKMLKEKNTSLETETMKNL